MITYLRLGEFGLGLDRITYLLIVEFGLVVYTLLPILVARRKFYGRTKRTFKSRSSSTPAAGFKCRRVR